VTQVENYGFQTCPRERKIQQKKLLFVNSNITVNLDGRVSPKHSGLCVLFTVHFEPGEIIVNLSFISDN